MSGQRGLYVRYGSKADMCSATSDVRYGPIADIQRASRTDILCGSGPLL